MIITIYNKILSKKIYFFGVFDNSISINGSIIKEILFKVYRSGKDKNGAKIIFSLLSIIHA